MKNCNYAEYRILVDQMFYGETQTKHYFRSRNSLRFVLRCSEEVFGDCSC